MADAIGYHHRIANNAKAGDFISMDAFTITCLSDYFIQRWTILWEQVKLEPPAGELTAPVREALDRWREDINLQAWRAAHGRKRNNTEWTKLGRMPPAEEAWLLQAGIDEYRPFLIESENH